MDRKAGPKLTDAQFFSELVDCTLPGLEEIPAAAARGDFVACRRLCAAHVRQSLQPDRFFAIPYEFPENQFTVAGESEEEAGERIKQHILISVGVPCQFEGKVDWFANPTYNGFKEWTWQVNRCPEWKLLAHLYHTTGDESYAETFAQLFDSWVMQAVAPEEDVSGGETLCWRTIECGIRMGANWPYTLFSFYRSSHFTDDRLVDWYKSVWEHGHRLRVNHTTCNWLIMEMNGLGQIGILYPQFRAAKEWLEFAVQVLAKELDLQVYPDHFHFELSTDYHYVVINNYMRLVRVAGAFAVPLPESFVRRIEQMLEVFVKLMRPDGCLPDLNDGCHDPVKTFIDEQIRYFPDNKVFAWVSHGRKGIGAPAYTSVALEYAGMMVMRSGWGEKDTWGFLDAGPFGTGHQHEDKLNLLIHAKGQYILTECGTYAYDGSEMRKYALSTRSHNTVRVDGMDQNRRAHYRWHEGDLAQKARMTYRIEEAFDYVSATYDEGYGVCDLHSSEAPAHMGASHSRSVFFLKKPGHGMEAFFLVIDRLQSENENEYELLWHVDAGTVSVHGMDVTADFLHLLVSLKDRKRDGVDLICGQQKPEWQGWKPGPTGIQGDDAPLPTVQYMTHGSNLRVVTVLYPGEDCPITAVEASRDVEDTRVTLVLRDGFQLDYDESLGGCRTDGEQ